MPDPFRGHIPSDRLYDTRHDMWVSFPDDTGRVRVGATAFGIFLAGEVIMFTGKPRGALVEAGRGLGTVETGKTVLAVRSPVTLHGLVCNEALEDSPQAINHDPYAEGWLGEGLAREWANDHARLVDAAAYIRHVLAVDPQARIED